MSEAIFAKIAGEAAAGGRGGRFVPGAGKLAVTKFEARSGFKGQTVILHARILESRATKPGIEPNPPGSAVDYVQTLDKLGAGGRVKAIVFALLGVKGQDVKPEAVGALIDEQVAEVTKRHGPKDALYTVCGAMLTDSAQPARGEVLAYDAYETATQKGQAITGLSLTHTGERVNVD
jgi:hypothetical protein